MPTVTFPPGYAEYRSGARQAEDCPSCHAESTREPVRRLTPDADRYISARRHLNPDGHIGGYVDVRATVDRWTFVEHEAMVTGTATVHRSYLDSYVTVESGALVNNSYLRRGVRVRLGAFVDGSDVAQGSTVESYESIINRHTDPPTPRRTCSRCGERYPQTTDYFSYSRDRWQTWCRNCHREYSRIHRATGRTRRTPAASNARAFGVEIEFHGDSRTLASEMRTRGLNCEVEGYNHDVSRYRWKIVPDGSVSNGAELVSPILQGEAGYNALRLASDALRAAGCSVTRDTGLHVHHEVRDLTVSQFKRVFELWHMAQEGIDLLVSPSRRHNSYCSHLDNYDMRAIRALTTVQQRQAGSQLSGDRFKNLNAQSFGRYGTLEVRQHQGTTSADKMCAWVAFGQAMIAHAREVETLPELPAVPYESICSLLGNIPLDEAQRTFLLARAAYFHGPEAPRDGDPEEMAGDEIDHDEYDDDDRYDSDRDDFYMDSPF